MLQELSECFGNFGKTVRGIITRIAPRSTEGKAVSSSESTYWKEPPYLHEQLIVQLWVHFIEAISIEAISRQDTNDLILVLEYIYSLNTAQIVQSELPSRKVQPLLLKYANKQLIKEQLRTLRDDNFYLDPNWPRRAMAILQSHCLTIGDPLFRPLKLRNIKQIGEIIANAARNPT